MRPLSNEAHYDRVTRAWGLLLGQNLHYGYFERGDESLDEATETLTLLLASQADLRPELSVLDVGCGTGAPAVFLAEHFGCRVLGISPSETGIELATARAASAGLASEVRFQIGSGTAVPAPDASFDRVWVMESSHLIPSKQLLYSECRRVLRPGGLVVLCDIILRSVIQFWEVIERQKELLLLRDVFGTGSLELLERHMGLAEAEGLRVTACGDISDQVFPTFARWKENAARNRLEVSALIGEESYAQFVAACDVLSCLWRENKFGYGVFAAQRY